MTTDVFLQFVVDQLNQCGIPFMVSGSVASGYHGEPRATFDIDLVIDTDFARLEKFCNSVAKRCYVSLLAAQEAVSRRSMFNCIDLDSGVKVDLILRKDRSFSQTEFQRREKATVSGVELFVATSEDCILSKLEWSRAGESERQFRDCITVARVVGERLDRDYLSHWGAELGLLDLLERLFEMTDSQE